MKLSEKVKVPAVFDGKDIIVDYDLWDLILGDVPGGYAVDMYKRVLWWEGGSGFYAIINFGTNYINVYPVVSLYFSESDIELLKDRFMRPGSSEDCDYDFDIITEYRIHYDGMRGESRHIAFSYFHTHPDYADCM